MTSSHAAAEALVLSRLSGFAALLRNHGMAVGADDLIAAAEALDVLDLVEPDALYLALRMAMVRRPGDLVLFDTLFARYWHGHLPAAGPPEERAAERPSPGIDVAAALPSDIGFASDLSTGEPAQETAPSQVLYSAVDVRRDRDFADYSDADFARLRELLRALRASGPWRTSRRRRPHRRGELDVRRTVRAALKTSGHPVARLYQRRRVVQRRVTFVCDVSRSMEPYVRAILELAHATVSGRGRRVEAFAFATGLTRVTRELLAPDPGCAIHAAQVATVGWSGGTRIGAAFGELNRRHAGALRGAVVVVASDGWDLGDPERLAEEAARIQRSAHSVIWVNPHLKDPAFEPLTRGMSATLPFIDHFVACHNFAAFEDLVDLLAEL